MNDGVTMPLKERLAALLDGFGIERAHLAAAVPRDIQGFLIAYPDRVASVTLMCLDGGMTAEACAPHQERLLCIYGDRGNLADEIGNAVTQLPAAQRLQLRDYLQAQWSDMAAERTEELRSAWLPFLEGCQNKAPVEALKPRVTEGETAGILYRVVGEGPPLVLLPMALAASQWEPLLPELSARYCCILLGGDQLRYVSNLEWRGQAGYVRMIRQVLDEAELRPGDAVLEVGCGTGIHVRALAARTKGANPITALDVNPFLLSEARVLSRRDGILGQITFEHGNAEALPFPDGSFDVVFASTVLEELDADEALDEMVRVTRPGGRVVATVRAVDRPQWAGVSLSPSVREKVEHPRFSGVVTERGCADASLYPRMAKAGLTSIKALPQLGPWDLSTAYGESVEEMIIAALTPEEVVEWRRAVDEARSAGAPVWVSRVFHCAVGTKSGG